MADINLLDWRSTSRRYQARLLYLAGTGSLFLQLIFWIGDAQKLNHSFAYWQQQYQLSNTLSAQHNRDRVRSRPETPIMEKLYSQYHHARRMIHDVTHFVETLPPRIKLTQIQYQPHQWLLSGLSKQITDVFLFQEQIKKIIVTRSITIKKIEQTTDVRFVIQISDKN